MNSTASGPRFAGTLTFHSGSVQLLRMVLRTPQQSRPWPPFPRGIPGAAREVGLCDAKLFQAPEGECDLTYSVTSRAMLPQFSGITIRGTCGHREGASAPPLPAARTRG